MGILERGNKATGKVIQIRTTVVSSRKKREMHPEVRKQVEAGNFWLSLPRNAFGTVFVLIYQ